MGKVSDRRADWISLLALGIAGTMAILVLAALLPAAVGGEARYRPGHHRPAPRPNLTVTDSNVKGSIYAFNDLGFSLSWNAVAKNRGTARSGRTKADLVLLPSHAGSRQAARYRWVLQSRKVPSLAAGHLKRVAGSVNVIFPEPQKLGAYWILVCVQKDRCHNTGRRLYVIKRVWEGTLQGTGGAGGQARGEKWNSVGPTQLKFEGYRGHGVFSYTFAGTIKWEVKAISTGGCHSDGTGLMMFDETNSGPGVVLRYDHGDYRGVVGALQEDFFTIYHTPGQNTTLCTTFTSPGPTFEDFLTIHGKHGLRFGQDLLRGSFGSAGSESGVEWEWSFG